jgi:hypothetical protein
VRAALGGAAVTRVLVDESLYAGERLAPGWRVTYVTEGAVAPVGPLMVDGGRVRPQRNARHGDPALAAGRAFAALVQPGADVAVDRGTAPAGAAALGEVVSPPVRRWSSGCSSAATTTWPRRWPARSPWPAAVPRPSPARRRPSARCSDRCSTTPASPAARCGSSTAAACRARTACSRRR